MCWLSSIVTRSTASRRARRLRQALNRRKSNGLRRGRDWPVLNRRPAVRAMGSGPSSMSVRAPVAVGSFTRNRRNTDNIISNTEMVGQCISTGTGFHVALTQTVNPGIYQSFPWLSPIANQYEYYELLSLRYRFQPAVATTTAGTAYIALDYDWMDSAPVSAMIMSAWQSTVSATPWVPFSFVARKEDLSRYKTEHMVWDSPTTPAGTDPRMYHNGHIYVAFEGVGAGLIGNLFCDYTVKLSVPEIDLAGPSNLKAAWIKPNGSGSKAKPFGDGSRTVDSELPLLVGNATLQVDAPGQYTLSYAGTGTGFPDLAGIVSTAGTGGSVIDQYCVGDAAGTILTYVVRFLVTAAFGFVLTVSTAAVTTLDSRDWFLLKVV